MQPPASRPLWHHLPSLLFGALAGFFGFALLFVGALPLLPLVAVACFGWGFGVGRKTDLGATATALAVALPMLPLTTLLVPAALRSSGLRGALVWAAVPLAIVALCWLGARWGGALRRRR